MSSASSKSLRLISSCDISRGPNASACFGPPNTLVPNPNFPSLTISAVTITPLQLAQSREALLRGEHGG